MHIIATLLTLAFALAQLHCQPTEPSDDRTLAVAITTSGQAREGERLSLRAELTGETGEVTYRWEVINPATAALKGRLISPLTSETQFEPPSLCANQRYDVRLTVKDDSGDTATAETSFEVENVDAPFAITQEPVTTTPSVVTGDLVTVFVTAQAPGCGPTYEWTQTAPPPTTNFFEGPTNAASVTWRAPNIPGTYSIGVTVTSPDGDSLVPVPVNVTVARPTYTAHIRPIFTRCTGCHGSSAPSGGLNLAHMAAADMRTELDRAPARGSCQSTNPKLLTAGSLADSVLWLRIAGNDCGTGERMPPNDSAYFETNKNLLLRMQAWIENGATFD